MAVGATMSGVDSRPSGATKTPHRVVASTVATGTRCRAGSNPDDTAARRYAVSGGGVTVSSTRSAPPSRQSANAVATTAPSRHHDPAGVDNGLRRFVIDVRQPQHMFSLD